MAVRGNDDEDSKTHTRFPGSEWKKISLTADERGIFACDLQEVWLGSACSSDHSLCSDEEQGTTDRSGLLFTDAAHLVL